MLKFLSSDHENILDPNDEENNKFVEVVKDHSDSEPEEGKFKYPKSNPADQADRSSYMATEKKSKPGETELPF